MEYDALLEIKPPQVYEVVNIRATLNIYGSEMQHTL